MNTRSPLQLERLLARVLHAGAIASTVLLTVGVVLTLAAPAGSMHQVLTTAGLLILMATPVARVFASVLGYASERDWTFFGLTLVVLATLAGSLVVALIG